QYQNAWDSCEVFRIAGGPPVSSVGILPPDPNSPATARIIIMMGDDARFCHPNPKDPETWIRIIPARAGDPEKVQPMTIELQGSHIFIVSLPVSLRDVVGVHIRCSGNGSSKASTYIIWRE
ncbi:MAG: hypothetical protein ACREJQ_08265, partial [bacterium]